jgi:hypothetical protein
MDRGVSGAEAVRKAVFTIRAAPCFAPGAGVFEVVGGISLKSRT